MPSTRRGLRVSALSLMLISTLSGCATMTGSDATDGPPGLSDVTSAACGAFRPITWSSHDTDTTIAKVKAHNAAYSALCAAAGSALGK